MRLALRRALLAAAPLVLLAPALTFADGDSPRTTERRGERDRDRGGDRDDRRGGGRGGDRDDRDDRGGRGGRGGGGDGGGGGTRSVPEFDPSAVGSIAALIGAGALVLGSRRKK